MLNEDFLKHIEDGYINEGVYLTPRQGMQLLDEIRRLRSLSPEQPDGVTLLSIDDIISGLSRALDGASIYPKMINVANEIDPVEDKAAYQMARKFYVMGWDSCIKQIGTNLIENGHKAPEREVVEEWQPPHEWHHYGMGIVRSRLLEDHVYIQGKNGDVWRVWLEMDGNPSIECIKRNAGLPKRNGIEDGN